MIRKIRYSHYNINSHLVWIPKYRKRVLVGTIKADLETAIREIAEKLEVKIESLEVQLDHIHLFVSAPRGCKTDQRFQRGLVSKVKESIPSSQIVAFNVD